ncbi:HIT family protein [Methanobacterium alcaliphilum]|uniref:HIT family protein n=1 Tax=Methanobacterium alcaliphilum TaxID=392018 RepID=UPI00200B19DE|nr:HIT family protein [Methanobacterium alcaliphilum]MCK9151211.1 HIT family protein [Methanobacterium alcaliphilum]
MGCEYCKNLEKYNFGDFLYETNSWIIFLAPNQSNLGTCVIALKRQERFLNSLTKEEWDEFSEIVNQLESSLKKAFNATMFNWGTLMNSFYLEDTLEPHMHWHFIPRYDHEVELDGELFEDPFFGYMRPRPAKPISEKIKNNIKLAILKELNGIEKNI